MSKPLIELTACEAVALLKSGEISPVDLLDAAEARIAEVDGVHAFSVAIPDFPADIDGTLVVAEGFLGMALFHGDDAQRAAVKYGKQII